MGAFCALHEIAGPGSVKQIGFAGEQVPFDFVGDSWSVSCHSSPITPSCADPGENKRKLRNPGACSIRREIKISMISWGGDGSHRGKAARGGSDP